MSVHGIENVEARESRLPDLQDERPEVFGRDPGP